MLLVFFLIGVESSNNWESDPSSPISAGTLGKITLIPICIVLGLLLFKVAGPLFGGTRFAARSEQYQQKAQTKIVNNRYRMGKSLPLAYGLAFVGIIQILIGISNADGSKVLIGIAIGVAGLYVRGRLQSVQAAAKALGARTLGDDVSQGVADGVNLVGQVVVGTAEFAVSTAIKGGKLLGTKIQKALEAQTNNSQSDNMAKELTGGVENMNMDDFNPGEWFGNFATVTTKHYQDHVSALKTAGARQVASATRVPVLTSRQALLDAFKQYEAGSKANAQRLINVAIASADSGSVSPDASEWPIDGPEIGRGNACMWGAIARVLAHKQAEIFTWKDATLSDSWFGAAFTIFLENNEWKMAGRALHEWAESRRLYGDEEGANILFMAAVCVFGLIGNDERTSLVANRPSESGPVAMDSSFFLNRPATVQESQVLSSVLGARNTHKFFKAVG
jgi:hypothetical protein